MSLAHPSTILSAADAPLRLIAPSFPGVLFTLDREGRFVSAAGRGCAQMGIETVSANGGGLPSLAGRPAADVFADEPGLIVRLDSALADTRESRWSAEVRGHTWEFYCTPLREEDGSPTGLTGIALNVTQRRHAEAEIRWRNREITALNSITAALTTTLEFARVVATLEHELATHLNILGGAVYLRGPGGEATLYRAWGIPPDLVERTSDLVIRGGRWVDDQRAGTRLLQTLFNAPLPGLADEESGDTPSRWQSAVSIPLRTNEQPLGTLILYSVEALALSKHGPAFFETLGHQVGAALQNARLFLTVSRAREELQHLTHRLVSAQEAERTRIARELHDEFGQILTCMKLSLELSDHPDVTPDVAAFQRAQARSLVEDMLAHVRQMTLELRTAVLDDMGLAAALEWYADRYAAQTGIAVDLDRDQIDRDTGQRFSEPVETAAYRIAQEALTNVARYARADRVSVRLSTPFIDPERRTRAVRLIIEDRGAGFDPQEYGQGGVKSSGLAGMRERAVALGGTLRVDSAPGRGTRIDLLLPIETEEEETHNANRVADDDPAG